MKGVQALQNEPISERRYDLARTLLNADHDGSHQHKKNGPEQREWDSDALCAVRSERGWAAPGPEKRSEETGHDEKGGHPERVNNPERKVQSVRRMAVDVRPV